MKKEERVKNEFKHKDKKPLPEGVFEGIISLNISPFYGGKNWGSQTGKWHAHGQRAKPGESSFPPGPFFAPHQSVNTSLNLDSEVPPHPAIPALKRNQVCASIYLPWPS